MEENQKQKQLYAMLSETRNLDRIQEYIASAIEIRGLNTGNVEHTMMLLTEELGEMAKAVRGRSKLMLIDEAKEKNYGSVESEAADLFIVLLSLCNELGINLYKCFLEKEKENIERKWKQNNKDK